MNKFNPDYLKNTDKEIFVFGSNLAGRHGRGAALTARQCYGAKQGLGSGPQRQSYAIPTKDCDIRSLPIQIISLYVNQFTDYVRGFNELEWHGELNCGFKFRITRIGCGLAGNLDEDICPLFVDLFVNDLCWFDETWKEYMPKDSRFWGTYQD